MNKINTIIEDNIYLIFLKCASISFFGTLFSLMGCSYIYKYFSLPVFSNKEKKEVYDSIIHKKNDFTEEQLKEKDFMESFPIFYKPEMNKETNEFKHSSRIYDTYIHLECKEEHNFMEIETPNAKYYIHYNFEEHRFDYWSDFNISFLHLLVGARKYVVTTNQECIYKLNFNDLRTLLHKNIEEEYKSDIDTDTDDSDDNKISSSYNHFKHKKKLTIDKENDYLFIKAKPKINKEVNKQNDDDIYENNSTTTLKNNVMDLSNNTLYNYIHFDLDDSMFIDNELTTFINKTIQFKKCGSIIDIEHQIHNDTKNESITNNINYTDNNNDNDDKTNIKDLPKPKTISFSDFKKMNLYKL